MIIVPESQSQIESRHLPETVATEENLIAKDSENNRV